MTIDKAALRKLYEAILELNNDEPVKILHNFNGNDVICSYIILCTGICSSDYIVHIFKFNEQHTEIIIGMSLPVLSAFKAFKIINDNDNLDIGYFTVADETKPKCLEIDTEFSYATVLNPEYYVFNIISDDTPQTIFERAESLGIATINAMIEYFIRIADANLEI